jgi:hypothetical protein
MLESSKMFAASLSARPPLSQLWTSPTESNISTESRMRDWVGAATSALLSDPARRNSPFLSKLFRGQNFEKGADIHRVLCSGLCSSVFHIFSVNHFPRRAVLKTAIVSRSVPTADERAVDYQSAAHVIRSLQRSLWSA